MPFEFSVEPPEGEPHKTVFTFSVTSQDTLDGLYSYVFGYFNPREPELPDMLCLSDATQRGIEDLSAKRDNDDGYDNGGRIQAATE